MEEPIYEAGLAVGFRSGLRELEQWQGFDRTFEPACDDRTPNGETRAGRALSY
ncbi:hypothetical protein [Paenibacillus ehimensis]|uniref:hypothetical protein n=1 Tax=Paenibacillus ehimensis TaxID=79264 RepID=UPI0013E2A695|nr:hypothetical protein [Paenibacillus ehimensis]